MARLRNRLAVLMAEWEVKNRRKLTQEELADAVGVSRETVSRMLRRGDTKLSSNTIVQLCAFFRCQPGDLLFIEYDDDSNHSSGAAA